MLPNGYSIVLETSGQFGLRYHNDVNYPNNYTNICTSFSYDDIMRALLDHRTRVGMEKEYWIS